MAAAPIGGLASAQSRASFACCSFWCRIEAIVVIGRHVGAGRQAPRKLETAEIRNAAPETMIVGPSFNLHASHQ